MSMKVVRNIVYMRPSEWRTVFPYLRDNRETGFVTEIGKFAMSGDETADQAWGGISADGIRQIEVAYQKYVEA